MKNIFVSLMMTSLFFVSSAVAAEKTLYERLGGEPAIKAVIEEFVARAAADTKVNFTRTGEPRTWKPTPENLTHLKQGLVAFVSEATGGPKNYKGAPMKGAHAGMSISNAEFDALAANLSGALDKFKVPAKEKQELLAIVGTTRADIVEEK